MNTKNIESICQKYGIKKIQELNDMWIIRVEDLNSQRDRLLSNFLYDDESVSRNYLKMKGYEWTSTEDIVEAKVWSTEEGAIRFLDSVNSLIVTLKSGGWKSHEFFIDKKLTIQELSYQEWNDINNW